jgi:hypothetical protein
LEIGVQGLVFPPWQCTFLAKSKMICYSTYFVSCDLFFPQNSVDSIKGKEMVEEWYLYDASTITECSDQIWNCVLYEALWTVVWSLVLLCKFSRRLLGRGPHCLECKCYCFEETSQSVSYLIAPCICDCSLSVCVG